MYCLQSGQKRPMKDRRAFGYFWHLLVPSCIVNLVRKGGTGEPTDHSTAWTNLSSASLSTPKLSLKKLTKMSFSFSLKWGTLYSVNYPEYLMQNNDYATDNAVNLVLHPDLIDNMSFNYFWFGYCFCLVQIIIAHLTSSKWKNQSSWWVHHPSCYLILYWPKRFRRYLFGFTKYW